MFKRVRSWFVDDLPAHLRRYSIRFLILIGIVQGVWMALPDRIMAGLPEWFTTAVNILLVVGGVYTGLLKQDIGLKAFAPPEKEPGE